MMTMIKEILKINAVKGWIDKVKKNKIINLKILFIIPLSIMILFAVVSGIISYTLNLRYYQIDLNNFQNELTESFSAQFSLNFEMSERIMSDIDDNILSAANMVVEHRSLLSNEYLATLSEIFGVDYIWFYSPEGEVLYDARDEYIGWTPTVGDWVYNFMNSELDVFYTGIRLADDMDVNLESVFVKCDDGSFIEVSASLETIMSKLSSFETQNIIDRLIENNPSLHYMLFVDKNYQAIADSDYEDIGIDYTGDEQYELAMNGTTNGIEWYYDDIGDFVYQVASPVYYDGEIIGIIAIGYSLSGLNSFSLININRVVLNGILLISSYIIFQTILVYRPLNRLNTELTINDDATKKIITKGRVFKGLFESINNYITTIENKNRLIKIESEKNYYNSNHDAMTELLNRRGFIDRLQHLEANSNVAVYYIDLDNFKHYNDLKGHAIGDKILIELANRLKTLENENIIVSRFGGDEFVIGLRTNEEEEITELALTIEKIIEEDIEIDLFMCYLSASVGVSVKSQSGLSVIDLLDSAESAMQKAKSFAHTKTIYFEDKLKEEIKFTTKIVEKLNECIANDGFEMVYQPQVDTMLNQVISLEALLRIKGDKMSPGIFVPIAEKNGLMNKIGRTVIKLVIEQIASWTQVGCECLPTYINLSSTQLHDTTIASYIKDLLEENHVQPSMFGVEITEDVFLDKEGLVLKTLKKLKQLGILTAIDDFGSGQAGVNYLTNLEVDLVKIGKDVADKYLNDEKVLVYQTAVNLCKSMHFKVLAEGIETVEQMNLLKKIDVHLVQGYFYFKPMKPANIEQIFKNKNNI